MGYQLEGTVGIHSKSKLIQKVPNSANRYPALGCEQFAEYGLRYVCRSIGMIGGRGA